MRRTLSRRGAVLGVRGADVPDSVRVAVGRRSLPVRGGWGSAAALGRWRQPPQPAAICGSVASSLTASLSRSRPARAGVALYGGAGVLRPT